MALKDMISSDINTVFLNNSELAGIINFGGLLISAGKEEVFSQEAMTGKVPIAGNFILASSHCVLRETSTASGTASGGINPN